MIKQKYAPLALVLINIIVFYQIIHHDFIYVDLDAYITNNQHVLAGLTLEGIRWAFTSFDFNWHPITWMSHMIDIELYGLNPGGHHFTSLILHSINSLLLFYLVLIATKAYWPSFVIVLIFAIHPMHVSPVVWTAARKDLLAAMFGFISIIFYLKQVGVKNHSYYFISILSFALSIMSKASFITLPILLLCLDFWPLKRFKFRKIIIEKLPYFLIAGGAALMTIIAQSDVGAITTVEQYSVYQRFANASFSYIEYIKQFIFPSAQSIFYPYRTDLNTNSFIIYLSVLSLITFCFFVLRNRLPYLISAWLWFLISLIPMIGLLQIGDHSHADRYTYIPYLGLSLIIVFLVNSLVKSQSLKILLLLSLILTLGFKTFNYVSVWKDSKSIYEYSLLNTKDNVMLHHLMALHYMRGKQYQAAIQYFKSTLEINPNLPMIYKRLGDAYFYLKQYDRAIENYNIFILNNPNNEGAYNNLGIIYLKKNQQELAKQSFEKALKANPNYLPAKKNLEALF